MSRNFIYTEKELNNMGIKPNDSSEIFQWYGIEELMSLLTLKRGEYITEESIKKAIENARLFMPRTISKTIWDKLDQVASDAIGLKKEL